MLSIFQHLTLATPDFHFKQFTIRHDRSSMKVGTDGVLLGTWACPHTEQPLPIKCLDIGTGTGLIALMLAQRFPTASITGIDIDDASIEQAKENVEASPFKEQILIKKQDFNIINLHSNKYELIVSNPPFYKEETLGGKQARDAARHTTSLPFNTLVENASKMLSENGAFSVIIPYAEAPSFISICAFNKLYLHRRLDVRSSERKPFKRTLLEFGKTLFPAQTDTLTLQDTHNSRTAEYAQLTGAFYI